MPIPLQIWRRLPVAALILGGALAWWVYGDALSFHSLAKNHESLEALRDAHYLLTSLGFVLLYAAVVLTSLPGALIMTLTGGFVFGLFPGVIYNVTGATMGAALVFLAARWGLGRDVEARMLGRGGRVAEIMQGLRENAWPVLLTLRLVPVVPFFLANLLPAFVGIRLSTFVLTTVLGILPAAVIYTSIGAGLGDVLARGEVPEVSIVTEPRFALPLLGLAVLAALPLVWRWFGQRGKGRA